MGGGHMHIVGIDLSLTGTGYYVLKTTAPHTYGRIEARKLRGVERLEYIREKLEPIIIGYQRIDMDGVDMRLDDQPDLVCLEGYSFGSQGRAVFQIGELGGVIRLMLHQRGINWIEISPSSVKKFATGKGNSKKDQVMLGVYKKWGFEAPTSDEADAFVLAHIGQAVIDYRPEELTKAQIEVADQVYASLPDLRL